MISGTTNQWGLITLSILVALVAAMAWLVGSFAERSLISELRQNLANRLNVHASGLLGHLDDYPAALAMLASDPRILGVLANADTPSTEAATARLRRYADLSGVDHAMILDAEGRIIADDDNDAGQAIKIAHWLKGQAAFNAALTSGLGRAFGRAGDQEDRRYFFIRRISHKAAPPTLLVVAVGINYPELLWRIAGQDILVVDRGGVVLLSTDQRRIFEFLGQEAQTANPIINAPYKTCREGAIVKPDTQMCLARSIARLSWDIYLLDETESVHEQVQLLRWVTVLGLTSLILLIGVVSQRRLAFKRTLVIKEDANRLLQQRVDRRTGELRAANQQLQAEIEERITHERALRNAQTELDQADKLAALGQLSAGMAHQLNQPLAALRAYADNARTFLDRGRPEAAAENLTMIGDLTERMGKITRDLKVLARRQPTRTEPVSLPPLIRSVIDQIEKANPAIETQIIYDGKAAMALAEPVGLHQVIANVIQNGIDAMEGIEDARARELTLSTSLVGQQMGLTIADRGTGIAPAIMDRIFDPFFTTKDVGKGLGLGLSLSASIIEDMGGHLSAVNRAGGGASFTITLNQVDRETMPP